MIIYKTLDNEQNSENITKLLNKHHEESICETPPIGETFSFAAFSDETYIGGITGGIWYEEMHISLLAIVPEYRGQAVGYELIQLAEKLAHEKNIKIITVTTQDYQAPAFYKRAGYTTFAKLIDCPFEGTTRYYFCKRM